MSYNSNTDMFKLNMRVEYNVALYRKLDKENSSITKTRLFKYIENFTTQKREIFS